MFRRGSIGLGMPLGKGDFENGQRVEFMLRHADFLNSIGLTPIFELKGELENDWVIDLHKMLGPWGGFLTWHIPNGSTKKLGDPEEPISAQLQEMAAQAIYLKANAGLRAVTIHCAPAMCIEPTAEAGLERYDSPISAAEMYAHIERQVAPLKWLYEATGDLLKIEPVDITNFRDRGFKAPTYLALQTGSWRDLIYLSQRSGAGVTFDSEHFLCARNFLMRQRDMKHLPTLSGNEVVDGREINLRGLAGYWLRKGYPPYTTVSPLDFDFAAVIKEYNPSFFHFGGAIQATNKADEICTHLPLDENNKEQMYMLDAELNWMRNNPDCLGGVIEVCGGDLYIEDKANPGHNRYSAWCERTLDDKAAKEESVLVVARRFEALMKK